MEYPVSQEGSDPRRKRDRLRRTLRCSQQEAAASATMTGTSDNFLNAFAIYLQASPVQLGWLTALPQLFGAILQIVSVWLGNHIPRKPLVVYTALVQSMLVAGMGVLALLFAADIMADAAVLILILLAIGYFACTNLIQPHWRAWMGGLVPGSRRGMFFATRTRVTMATSLLVFLLGGSVLSLTDAGGLAWIGFATLFIGAAIGRFCSSLLFRKMHDPHPDAGRNAMRLRDSWQHIGESLRDPAFRNYSLFVACMQGASALSAPFFAVYQLSDLQFTYLQFSLSSMASIATQFVMLRYWGKFSDRFGNRFVMIIASSLLPIVPLLWLISPDFGVVLIVQVVSGFAWSGFTLSTSNYLYDIRPHHTNFALYAAVQSGSHAFMVFCGGLLGGYLALHSADIAAAIATVWEPRSALYFVFIASAAIRTVVALGFLPRLHETNLRRRPQVLEVIFRVARFNAVSGVVIDWLSVTRKNGANGGGGKYDSDSHSDNKDG